MNFGSPDPGTLARLLTCSGPGDLSIAAGWREGIRPKEMTSHNIQAIRLAGPPSVVSKTRQTDRQPAERTRL